MRVASWLALAESSVATYVQGRCDEASVEALRDMKRRCGEAARGRISARANGGRRISSFECVCDSRICSCDLTSFPLSRDFFARTMRRKKIVLPVSGGRTMDIQKFYGAFEITARGAARRAKSPNARRICRSSSPCSSIPRVRCRVSQERR